MTPFNKQERFKRGISSQPQRRGRPVVTQILFQVFAFPLSFSKQLCWERTSTYTGAIGFRDTNNSFYKRVGPTPLPTQAAPETVLEDVTNG